MSFLETLVDYLGRGSDEDDTQGDEGVDDDDPVGEGYDSDASLSSSSSSSSSSSYADYDPDKTYSYAQLGPGLYSLKISQGGDAPLVIARSDHPLIAFVRSMRNAEDGIVQTFHLDVEPPSTASVDKTGVPGVVARVVSDKLYHRPLFCTKTGDVFEPKGFCDSINPPIGAECIPEEMTLFTLDETVDAEIDERYTRLERVNLGADPSILRWFDMSHNEGNLDRFTLTGLTGVDEGAFSAVSPVKPDEEWFVVKLHYFAMFLAFDRILDKSNSLYAGILQGSKSAGFYSYGASNLYDPKQESEVLSRVLEASTAESESYSAGTNLQKSIEEVLRVLPILENLPLHKPTLLEQLPHTMDPGTAISTAVGAIQELREATRRLQDVTSKRFKR